MLFLVAILVAMIGYGNRLDLKVGKVCHRPACTHRHHRLRVAFWQSQLRTRPRLLPAILISIQVIDRPTEPDKAKTFSGDYDEIKIENQ
jgi:hypothetical protein